MAEKSRSQPEEETAVVKEAARRKVAGKIPADSAWRQRIRELVGSGKKSEIARSIVGSHGSKSLEVLLGNWTKQDGPCSAPGVDLLHLIAVPFQYPIVEQLKDLGYITPDDLDLIDSPLLAPNWVLLERLERAISESRRNSSHAADLILALRASTLETKDFARWRARVFDIPAGTDKYRHIGFHAVEFEAWLGTMPPLDQNDRLKYRLSLANKTLERLIPSESIRASRTLKGRKVEDLGLEKYLGNVERAELEHRFGHLRAVGHFNTYGNGGTLAAPLLGLENPGVRHVYVESSSTQDDIASSKWHSPDTKIFGPLLNRVVLVAPPAASVVPIGNLVGRALGWTVHSLRQDAGTSAGKVVHISDQVTSEVPINRALRTFRTASAKDRPSILVTTYTRHLSSTDEGRRILLDPSSIIILVRPTFRTLQAWAARQRIGQGSSRTVSPEIGREYLDNVESTIRQRPAGTFHILDYKEDLNWWPASSNDRVHSPGRFPSKVEFFEHPTIGDARLRAAYQISSLLIRGKMPTAETPDTYFIEGPVARFQNELRRDQTRALRKRK